VSVEKPDGVRDRTVAVCVEHEVIKEKGEEKRK
jgi:hypothetical protein